MYILGRMRERKGETRVQDKINAIMASIPIPAKEQRVVISIDGLSRSGKTTLVKKIQACLHKKGLALKTLHIDDYIVERNRRYHTGYEEWHEYYHLQWDVQSLQETQQNLDKFKNRYWKAEDYYEETECPKERANVVFEV